MNLFALSGLLACISSFIFGIFSWVKGKKSLNKIWGIFNLSVAIWGLGAFKFSTTLNQKEVFFWLRFGHIGVILMPVLFIHFVFEWLGVKNKKALITAYFLGVIFFTLNITDWMGITKVFIVSLRYVFNSFYVDSPPGPAYPLFVVFFLSAVIYTHYYGIKYLRISKGLKSIQLKYFLIATALGYAGGGTAFLMVFNIDIYPFLHFTIVLYPIIMTYAIFKYHLMDIRTAVTRAGIFLVVYAFVLGVPFWLGFKIGLWVWALILMGILASVGPIIYRLLQKKVEDLLLAQQRHYQKILLQAGEGMMREHNMDRLLKLIVHIVKRAVKIKFAAIFSNDRGNKTYILKAARDHKAISSNIVFNKDSSLITYIREKGSPFVSEEMPYELKELLQKELGNFFDLVVPCVIENKVLGFLILGEKLDKSAYTQDDINVFEILSRQTALAIEYCIFLEEFQKSQERIFTAEKLASIGGMASGVAHQIRNRLAVFGAHAGKQELLIEDFIENHPELITQNPGLKEIFLRLIEEINYIQDSVQKAGKLIKGILDFAGTQQRDVSFSSFPLQEAIGLSLPPLKTKHSIADDAYLDIKTENCFIIIYGSKGQIVEVIFNLIDNSYEAILEKLKYRLNEEEKKNFKPFIKIKLTETEISFIIQISDNGIGIKEEDKLRIFSPYFTTKTSTISGTGIGMFVVKRIVEENHKGKIWFESTYMKGTKFFVEIPKKEK